MDLFLQATREYSRRCSGGRTLSSMTRRMRRIFHVCLCNSYQEKGLGVGLAHNLKLDWHHRFLHFRSSVVSLRSACIQVPSAVQGST